MMQRELAYEGSAAIIESAGRLGSTTVSMRRDWGRAFPGP